MSEQSPELLQLFARSESGETSSDWIVLSAFVIVLAIGASSSISRPATALAESLPDNMQVSTSVIDKERPGANSDGMAVSSKGIAWAK